MTLNHETRSSAYQELLSFARRFVRTRDEACDLVQDAVMIALDRGFDDWHALGRRPWLFGVLRKRAAFVMRGAKRRGERERDVAGIQATTVGAWLWRPSFLASLPPSLRALATLASADLCAAEIRWLLSLTDTALRSRLSALQKAVQAEAEPPTQPAPEPQTALGIRRAQLLASLRRFEGHAVATHDPDGHAILFTLLPHKSGVVGNR